MLGSLAARSLGYEASMPVPDFAWRASLIADGLLRERGRSHWSSIAFTGLLRFTWRNMPLGATSRITGTVGAQSGLPRTAFEHSWLPHFLYCSARGTLNTHTG